MTSDPLMSQEAALLLEEWGVDPDVLDDSNPVDMVLIHVFQQYAQHQVQAFQMFAEMRTYLADIGEWDVPGEPIANFPSVRQLDDARVSMDALKSTMKVAVTAFLRDRGLHVRPTDGTPQ